MSAKIQKLVSSEMLERAHDRINKMGFTAEQQEFIFADWTEGNEHIAWLLIASKDEIDSWGAAGEWGVVEREEI